MIYNNMRVIRTSSFYTFCIYYTVWINSRSIVLERDAANMSRLSTFDFEEVELLR